MTDQLPTSPEERALKRAKEYVALMWHIAAFVIINTFLWGLDWVTGGGIQWAYWSTLGWGIGLFFHIAAYALDDSGLEARAYRKFLAKEQERQTNR